MEQTGKKRMGRPPKNPVLGARSAADRQRDKRVKQDEALNNRDSHEWDEADCLRALARPGWRGTPMGEAAWRQLGILLKYS